MSRVAAPPMLELVERATALVPLLRESATATESARARSRRAFRRPERGRCLPDDRAEAVRRLRGRLPDPGRRARRDRPRLPVDLLGGDDLQRHELVRRLLPGRGPGGALRDRRPADERRVRADRNSAPCARRLRRQRALAVQHGLSRRPVDVRQRDHRGRARAPAPRRRSSSRAASCRSSTTGMRAGWPGRAATPSPPRRCSFPPIEHFRSRT